MKLQTMFQKDINRDINGVVKVAQNDDNSLKQELSEYIITRELRRHFSTFFDNYSRAIDRPTDKIGVWISGFFGSGKSHFLKMLSYLLSNQEVCGKRVIDYFADKFDDPTTICLSRTRLPNNRPGHFCIISSMGLPAQMILMHLPNRWKPLCKRYTTSFTSARWRTARTAPGLPPPLTR